STPEYCHIAHASRRDMPDQYPRSASARAFGRRNGGSVIHKARRHSLPAMSSPVITASSSTIQKSRRTLTMPQLAVDALRAHTVREKRSDGLGVRDEDMPGTGREDMRREFWKACKAAGVGPGWTPRELHHTGISLLSLGGLPVEEIARIAVRQNGDECP